MAIDMKEFTQKVDTGLKANKAFTRFFYRFKVDTVTKRGLIDYTSKNWDKKERIKQAKAKKLEVEEEVKYRSTSSQITEIINTGREPTLNDAADMYFDVKMKGSVYADRIKRRYDLYCRNEDNQNFNMLGRIKLNELVEMHLDTLRNCMEIKGLSKQTKNGCSMRTIKEIFQQAITPILQYAKQNKLVRDYPVIQFEKQKRKKKKVVDAKEKFVKLFNSINTLYKDDPFYRSLFLFALYGRRWGEIKTLHWSEIDFANNRYTILEEHCKIDETQTYELPPMIATALLEIKDDHNGLVFKSPITNKELYTPKKQLEKIKEASGIPELTMHLFRHILVSAMGEVGVVGTVLSASLGHTNLDTVNDFYLTANHTKASGEANKVIDGIIT